MDREFEHVMMNIKGKTGSITQAIYEWHTRDIFQSNRGII